MFWATPTHTHAELCASMAAATPEILPVSVLKQRDQRRARFVTEASAAPAAKSLALARPRTHVYTHLVRLLDQNAALDSLAPAVDQRLRQRHQRVLGLLERLHDDVLVCVCEGGG